MTAWLYNLLAFRCLGPMASLNSFRPADGFPKGRLIGDGVGIRKVLFTDFDHYLTRIWSEFASATVRALAGSCLTSLRRVFDQSVGRSEWLNS